LVRFAFDLIVVAVEVADSVDVELVNSGSVEEFFEFDLGRHCGFDGDGHNPDVWRFGELVDHLEQLGILELGTEAAVDPLAAFV
jgi:hypothetical protein